ncbi:MAG: hypothetical protein M0Z71_00185 [Nitrospiraceae bacterium]|nr:hypothetical protein [Nitrospiraceae bacterium]
MAQESMVDRQSPIEEFGELGDDIGKFLQKNYGLIVQKAKKKFGDNFNVPEVLSDAVEAWHAMKDYHSKSQFTKHTTSYSWFLNRQLDMSYRLGVTVDSRRDGSRYSGAGDANTPDVNEINLDRASRQSYLSRSDEDGLDQEERLLYVSEMEENYGFSEVDEECEDGEKCRMAKRDSVSYIPRYAICLESFRKCPISGDLRLLLQALSDNNTSLNRGRYRKVLASRRSISAISGRLRQHLFYETARAGYDLYIGVCSNGGCNNVLVAARSHDDASKYLARYGRLIDLRQLSISQGAPEESDADI